ncbi:MAG: GNAT family N-acetyltransferase [Acidaminobacteraceae bacterium]
MTIINVNSDNIDHEHICCAISEKKGENCAGSKKDWMKERFSDGLVFKKLDERGKVFIEYIPSENAFAPIVASNYMYINCFWVSGKFKGQGYANVLLEECIKDAKEKGKYGLTILSSKKKIPFLSDPKFLKYKGFKVCDSTSPYYELLYLPFTDDKSNPIPRFNESVHAKDVDKEGIVLYYTNQCPHTEKYANLIKDIADGHKVKFKLNKIRTTKEAQLAPAPFTTYSMFINGVFETNEILSEKKFLKIITEKELI